VKNVALVRHVTTKWQCRNVSTLPLCLFINIYETLFLKSESVKLVEFEHSYGVINACHMPIKTVGSVEPMGYDQTMAITGTVYTGAGTVLHRPTHNGPVMYPKWRGSVLPNTAIVGSSSTKYRGAVVLASLIIQP